VLKAISTGAQESAGLSADETRAFEQLRFVYAKRSACGAEMTLRPQTGPTGLGL
jgi:hypothetical protein